MALSHDKSKLLVLVDGPNLLDLQKKQFEECIGADQASWAPDDRHIIFRNDENIYFSKFKQDRVLIPADFTKGQNPTWSPRLTQETIDEIFATS